MYAADRNALLCDLAEIYGVYSFDALPTETLAVLATGLSPNSRIMRKIAGKPVDDTTLLLSIIIDRLSTLVWLNTEDAQHRRNRPESLVERLLRHEEEKEAEPFEVFDSPDAFMTARAIILMGE